MPARRHAPVCSLHKRINVAAQLPLQLLRNSADTAHAHRRIAEDFGLQEGRDYVHVCLGTEFAHLVDNLRNDTLPAGVPRCDVGASIVTATSERRDAGVEFSSATYRNKLAVMVHGTVEGGGLFGFFKPLHTSVWLAVLGTILVVPFFVWLCEYVLLRRCAAARACGLGAVARTQMTSAVAPQTPSVRARSVCSRFQRVCVQVCGCMQHHCELCMRKARVADPPPHAGT